MVKVTDLEFLCLSFVFNVTMSVFVNPLMDLIPVWQCDSDWSKILSGNIPNPVHDLKVKVTECFVLFFFAKPSMDLNHVSHDDRTFI